MEFLQWSSIKTSYSPKTFGSSVAAWEAREEVVQALTLQGFRCKLWHLRVYSHDAPAYNIYMLKVIKESRFFNLMTHLYYFFTGR